MHLLVRTPTDKGRTIRAEQYPLDRDLVRSERVLVCPRLGIPHPYRLVPTPSGKDRPIRAERDALDRIRMPGEPSLMFTRFSIPQIQQLVRVPTDNCLSVRAKCYMPEPIYIRGEHGNHSIGRCIVEPNTDRTTNNKPRTVRRIQNLR